MDNYKPSDKNMGENERKFLDAIEKYARQQREALVSETELFEKNALQKAEEDGLRDAYNLIHKEQDSMRASIAAEIAKKEAEGNLEIFKKRQQITKDVFTRATAKLQDYANTLEYEKKLISDAKECAEFFGVGKVEICLSKKDMKLSDRLSALFEGESTVKEVSDIKIGGFRVYCSERQIAIDRTLDAKLEQQKEWFYANSGLQVK